MGLFGRRLGRRRVDGGSGRSDLAVVMVLARLPVVVAAVRIETAGMCRRKSGGAQHDDGEQDTHDDGPWRIDSATQRYSAGHHMGKSSTTRGPVTGSGYFRA